VEEREREKGYIGMPNRFQVRFGEADLFQIRAYAEPLLSGPEQLKCCISQWSTRSGGAVRAVEMKDDNEKTKKKKRKKSERLNRTVNSPPNEAFLIHRLQSSQKGRSEGNKDESTREEKQLVAEKHSLSRPSPFGFNVHEAIHISSRTLSSGG
jgi:hypothetical protein